MITQKNGRSIVPYGEISKSRKVLRISFIYLRPTSHIGVATIEDIDELWEESEGFVPERLGLESEHIGIPPLRQVVLISEEDVPVRPTSMHALTQHSAMGLQVSSTWDSVNRKVKCLVFNGTGVDIFLECGTGLIEVAY